MLAVFAPSIICVIAAFSCFMLTGAISLSRWVIERFGRGGPNRADRIWIEVVKNAVPVPAANLSQICIDIPDTSKKYHSIYGPHCTYQQPMIHPFDIDGNATHRINFLKILLAETSSAVNSTNSRENILNSRMGLVVVIGPPLRE